MHESFVRLAKEPHDIAFYGDSITHHFLETPLWRSEYVPLKAFNFGISGDRIEELWWRVRNGELLSSNPPKVMVVMIGTNNLWDTSNEVVIKTIDGLLTDMHQIAPSSRIILLGIFSRGPNAEDPYRKRVIEVNKQLAKFENKNWLYYLDFGDKFIEPDGTITLEMMPDLLHLSEKGYAIWVREMKPLLTKLLSMPPLPVSPLEPGQTYSNHTTEVKKVVEFKSEGRKKAERRKSKATRW
eukprot:gene25812-31172_t